MKKIILTGDRPTGKLHLGHFVGSLQTRVNLQNSGEYDSFIMIADLQALTDNAKNPEKIRDNVLEVALDYLAVGIDPAKSTIFIQSQIPALSELTMYYMNLVSLSRVLRNPTVKSEIVQKFDKFKSFALDEEDAFEKIIHKIQSGSSDREIIEIVPSTKPGSNLSISQGNGITRIEISYDYNRPISSVPAGFAMYPISQAADITAFRANLVPVGEDQSPMIELTREIVRSFNQTYGETLVEPDALTPTDELSKRLPGIDGNTKMSKSLNNGIYLSDDYETLKTKVMSMFTDPDHIHVDDPGKIAGNTVFTYLDVFAGDKQKVAEMKSQYQKGGLGDVTVKKYLLEVLDEILKPIRERRAEFAKNPDQVYEMLKTGSEKANKVAAKTLQEVRAAIGVNYFG